MSDSHDVIKFMCNPKVSKEARIQLGLGMTLCFVTILMVTFEMPVYPLLIAAILLTINALIVVSREDTPICTIGNNALEFKNPAPMGALKIIPLDSILSVSREKRRIAVESSYQSGSVNLPIRLFNPEQVDDLYTVLNQYASPQEARA